MGVKTKKYKNGEVYQGQMKNNKRHGYGVHEWPDQRIYEGQWADDMMNGHGVYTWIKENRTYEGRFLNDNMTGAGWYQDTDRIIVGEFQNGVLHGKGVQFSVEGNNTSRIIVGSSWFLGDLLSGFEIVMGKDDVVESLKQHKKTVKSAIGSKDANTIHAVISFVDKSKLDVSNKQQDSGMTSKLVEKIESLEKLLEKAEGRCSHLESQIAEYEAEKTSFQQYISQLKEQFEQQKSLLEQYDQLKDDKEGKYQLDIARMSKEIELLKKELSSKEAQLLQQLENEKSNYKSQIENYEKMIKEHSDKLTQYEETIMNQKSILEQYEQSAMEKEVQYQKEIESLKADLSSKEKQLLMQMGTEKEAASLLIEKEYEDKLAEYENTIEKQKQDLEKLQQIIDSQEQKISSLESQVASKSSVRNDFSKKVSRDQSAQIDMTSPRRDISRETTPRSATSISPLVSPGREEPTPRAAIPQASIETNVLPKISENPFVKKMSMSKLSTEGDGQSISKSVVPKANIQPVKEETKVVDFRAHLRKTNLLENLEKKKENLEKEESVIDFRAHLRNK
jgi:myosin heavy subunit